MRVQTRTQYAQRCVEEGDAVSGGRTRLPLFVLDSVVFPGQNFPLHIFEPHYRLMLRRALEGSRTFGVVYTHNGQVVSVGTSVEILNHVSLMDGRSLVQTVGRRRFEITEMGEVDGYAVGDVNYFDDLPLSDAVSSNSASVMSRDSSDVRCDAVLVLLLVRYSFATPHRARLRRTGQRRANKDATRPTAVVSQNRSSLYRQHVR